MLTGSLAAGACSWAIPGVWLQRPAVHGDPVCRRRVPLIGWAVVLVAFRCSRRACCGPLLKPPPGAGRALRVFIGLRRHAAILMVGIFYHSAPVCRAGRALVGSSAALTGYVLGAGTGMGLTLAGGARQRGVRGALVVLIMALWFAPSLVLFRRRPSKRCAFRWRPSRNVLPFRAHMAVILYVLIWLAMLPAGLGMLVLVPVMAAPSGIVLPGCLRRAPGFAPEAPPDRRKD